MQVLQEWLGKDDDNLARAAVGFGGGIAGRQSECGALVGGVMALGLKLAPEVIVDIPPEAAEARQKLSQASRALLDSFAGEFGSTTCRTLTGYDFSQPGAYQDYRADSGARGRCFDYLEFVIRRLAAEP